MSSQHQFGRGIRPGLDPQKGFGLALAIDFLESVDHGERRFRVLFREVRQHSHGLCQLIARGKVTPLEKLGRDRVRSEAYEVREPLARFVDSFVFQQLRDRPD
jgi:hypothetical protein